MMTKWNVMTTLILIGFLLFLRVRGILWLCGGLMLLGGLIFSLKCYRRRGSVMGAAIWTVVLASVLFLLGAFLPNIRLWELLYI